MNPWLLLFLRSAQWYCFLRVRIKGEHLIPICTSIMYLLKLPSTILIFTGIVHAMVKGKPNTFWSKRTGEQELSDKMQKDGSQCFSESRVGFSVKFVCFSNQKKQKGLAIPLESLKLFHSLQFSKRSDSNIISAKI